MFVRNFNISQKILLPMMVMLILLISVFAYLFSTLTTGREQVIMNIEHTKGVIKNTDKLHLLDYRREKLLWDYRINKELLPLQIIEQLDAQHAELLIELKEQINDESSSKVYQDYIVASNKSYTLRDRWLAAEIAGNRERASQHFAMWEQQRLITNAVLMDLVSYHTSLLDDNIALLNRIIKQITFSYILIVAFAFLISVSLFFYLKHYVINPLVELSKAAANVVSGNENFDVKVSKSTRDEIGILYRSLHSMVSKLNDSFLQMQNMALHDSLTGLPNRKAAEEHFEVARNKAERNGTTVTVMFIDLDRFKSINDTLGHYIGDMILKEVGARFQSVVRKEDMLARLGGDEFMLLLTDTPTEMEIGKVAKKLLTALETPMIINGHVLYVATSVGIAVYPNDGEEIYTLLKNADTALYRAKELGRNRFQFYDQSMNFESYQKLTLETALRNALKQGQIQYYYQPILDRKGKTTSAEALIRWSHPTLGLLHPDAFLGLAEEIGMIVALEDYALAQACTDIDAWKEHGIKSVPTVSLNFSNRHFSEFDLIEKIVGILKDKQCTPGSFEIEITESTAMNNTERSQKKLHELKEIGIPVNIDDFGTGYSSLSYLKSFPIRKLKIDKSFVKHCTEDEQDKQIIRAIVFMAHSLHIEVVAEGIETYEQFELLYTLGCDHFQGFLFCEPLPAEQMMEWLNNDVAKKYFNQYKSLHPIQVS